MNIWPFGGSSSGEDTPSGDESHSMSEVQDVHDVEYLPVEIPCLCTSRDDTPTPKGRIENTAQGKEEILQDHDVNTSDVDTESDDVVCPYCDGTTKIPIDTLNEDIGFVERYAGRTISLTSEYDGIDIECACGTDEVTEIQPEWKDNIHSHSGVDDAETGDTVEALYVWCDTCERSGLIQHHTAADESVGNPDTELILSGCLVRQNR